MATYEEIYGKRVKEFDSDPTLDSSYEGQVWYDKSSGTLRSVVAISAWASSTPLPIATNQSGGAGVNTASLVFGGTSPANNAEDATYEYNGSGYSNSGNLNTSRTGISGAGTQTAALGAGGYLFPGGSNHTETYNGTSWTAVTAMPSANSYCSCGTQTAAIYVTSSTTLEYSSPSWSSGGGLNTPRAEASMAGTQTANIFFGGGPQTSASSASEEYDGTSFTNSATMNTARGIQIGGSGVQTSALAYGGAGPTEPGTSAATESWNGTSWSTEGSLGTVTRMMQKGGSTSSDSSSAISAGGLTPSRSSKTEEYSFSINTITAAAWSSGGPLNNGRTALGGAGVKSAALAAGGGSQSVHSEEYNGSTWTEGNNLNTGRAVYGSMFGSQTASGCCGGEISQGSNAYEQYDGTSWTSGNNMNQAAMGRGSFGTTSSAISASGFQGPSGTYINETESFDGTSWTSLSSPSNTNDNGNGWGAAGTVSAGLIFGSYPTTTPRTYDKTEEWNGSAWSNQNTLITGRYANAGWGTQTSAIAACGYGGSSAYNNTEAYDGTVWSTRVPTTNGARYQVGGAGTDSSSGLAFGGSASNTATEEFTGETSTITASTLTSS